MTRDQYLRFHEDFCKEARELSAKKNSDYTGSGGENPFSNFTRVEILGIASTEQGFLTRMMDKFCRLVTFCNEGKLQVNESVYDTLLDLINYSCLLAAYIKDKEDGFPVYCPSCQSGPFPAETKCCPDCGVDIKTGSKRLALRFCSKCGHSLNLEEGEKKLEDIAKKIISPHEEGKKDSKKKEKYHDL